MRPTINSPLERSNGTRMISVGSCKINIEVGPALTCEWTNLIACMYDETESVSGMLLGRLLVHVAPSDWMINFEHTI